MTMSDCVLLGGVMVVVRVVKGPYSVSAKEMAASMAWLASETG
jgi:hypothetical protein